MLPLKPPPAFSRWVCSGCEVLTTERVVPFCFNCGLPMELTAKWTDPTSSPFSNPVLRALYQEQP